MYVKPRTYKIFSIISLLLGIVGFVFSIVGIIKLNDILTYIKELVPQAGEQGTLFIVMLTLFAVVSLAICYVEFSMMYVFADMIEHEQSKYTYPLRKNAFILPANSYNIYGIVVFVVSAISSIIAGTFSIINLLDSDIGAFGAILLIVLIIAVLCISVLVSYVHYYVRCRSVSYLMSAASGDESDALNNKLRTVNPNALHIYCTVLWYVFIVFSIAAVALIFIGFKAIKNLIGTGVWIGIGAWLVFAIFILVEISVLGCFVDNIGIMVEHYQYKRKLVSYD